MLKVRPMGTRSDINWFGKILQRNPKIEVTEFSDLFPNEGTRKCCRACMKVKKSNVKEEQQIAKENGIVCKIVAIANQEGGVGKTTATSDLGIGLTKQGKKALSIDTDAQGSLTASSGCTRPDTLGVTLVTTMGDSTNNEEAEPTEGILHHEEGVDLMSRDIELSGLEVSLVDVISRETILRSYIEIIREDYGYILIDYMPSLGTITIDALACADNISISVQAAYLPVKGLQQLIKMVGGVKRKMNPKLETEGILLTIVDGRANYAKNIGSTLKDAHGSSVRIFTDIIPTSVRAAEISTKGISIYKYGPKGKVAAIYDSLTKKMLANGQQ